MKSYTMFEAATLGIREGMETIHFSPAITIIMPFEPKMTSKKELSRLLQVVISTIEHELADNYPDEISMLMMQKLQVIFSSLNFMTHKQSIAIYVSPVFERVLYLNIPVKDRIIIGDAFEIRELVQSKKRLHQYLVLLLGSKQYDVYLGDSNALKKIVSNTSESINLYLDEAPANMSGLLDKPKTEEIAMNKYLNHVDNTMTIILNAYPLPLFITGTKKIVEQFKNSSKNTSAVTEYVFGNYEETTLDQLQEIFKPYLADWKKVIQTDLLNQLKQAAVKNKLAIGIQDVWREAMNHNGRLLVVEKNYRYAPEPASIDDMIYKAVQPYNGFSYTKDVLGDIIEKVLENGGDVEFVDKDIVEDYRQIALVQYY